jgi:hypothetical protein
MEKIYLKSRVSGPVKCFYAQLLLDPFRERLRLCSNVVEFAGGDTHTRSRIKRHGIPQWWPPPAEVPPDIEAKQIVSLFSAPLSHFI